MKLKIELRKFWFIIPGGIGTFMFYMLPLCYCFLYAFSGTSGRFTFAGLSNYKTLFRSDSFCLALGNTYLMLLWCVVVLILVTMALVYFLDVTRKIIFWLLLFSLPMLLPATLITQSVKEFAVAPRVLLVTIFLWKYVGFHTLLLKAMEMNMSPEYIEAAVLEKATKWQVFTKIKVRYLWPYLRFLLIFDGICFFRLFRESYLLYGQYPPDEVYMITNFFFNNFQNLNYRRLSAATVIALVPILIINGVLLKVGKQHEMV